jgi:DNA adenine methylase
MRYMGGKTRIAKQLAEVIDQYRQPGQLVWDAFCGGLSVSVALSKNGPVLSSDACAPLISLYKAVQNGWEPPAEVSKETYLAAKTLPDTDPMKAFCGFGCSFGGKWFAGYAKGFNGPLTYPQLAARNVKSNVSKCSSFDCIDFNITVAGPCDFIFYLDPPYSGTTGYSGVKKFDHNAFVSTIASWSRYTSLFVSEYSLPIGTVVWERASTGTLGIDHGVPHVEKLFYIAKGSL